MNRNAEVHEDKKKSEEQPTKQNVTNNNKNNTHQTARKKVLNWSTRKRDLKYAYTVRQSIFTLGFNAFYSEPFRTLVFCTKRGAQTHTDI